MNRTTTTIRLVLQDSVYPASLPAPQTITFAQWEDGQIPFQCVNSDGTPANITGGAIILTVRGSANAPLVLSREGTPTDYSVGTGYFPIGSFDTGIPVAAYRADVFYIDSSGKDWQPLPVSDFIIIESEFIPNTPVTVPSSQLPLAQGPTGPTGATGPQGPIGPPGGTSVTPYSCLSGLSVDDAVYISGNDAVSKASASSAATAPVLGFVLSKPTTTSCTVRWEGEITGFTGLVANTTYFLDTVAGGITANISGFVHPNIIQRVGIARNSTTLVLKVDLDFEEL